MGTANPCLFGACAQFSHTRDHLARSMRARTERDLFLILVLAGAKVLAHELGDFYVADVCCHSLSEIVEFFCNEPIAEDVTLIQPVPPAAPVRKVQRQAAVVQKRYEAQSADELSVNTGAMLTVLSSEDSHWLCE